jgi:hypothetical protein
MSPDAAHQALADGFARLQGEKAAAGKNLEEAFRAWRDANTHIRASDPDALASLRVLQRQIAAAHSVPPPALSEWAEATMTGDEYMFRAHFPSGSSIALRAQAYPVRCAHRERRDPFRPAERAQTFAMAWLALLTFLALVAYLVVR